jgi:glycosyltransferase involved in cell wall biosynthesis
MILPSNPPDSINILNPKVAAIVPAFNENGRIGRVVGAISREIVDEIILVDDHSTDGTAGESIRHGATHVISSPSHGVGAAIKTGYCAASKMGADILVVLAGDGQHDPNEIPKIIEPLLRDQADYVVGNRLSGSHIGNGMSPFRYFGNRLLTFATRLMSGLDVKDSQSGFTAIRRDALERLDINRITDSWGVPNDLLFECAAQRLRVRYVKVKALNGGRRSYIRLHSYVPRLAYILLRGKIRVAAARLADRFE